MEVLAITDKIDNEQSFVKKQQSILLQQANHNPSATSPTHEFSFSTSLPPAAAIDLTPADDIFLHGHLLPLYLPISPRSSTVDTVPKNLSFDTNCHQTTFSYSNEPVTDQNQQKSKSFSVFRMPKWKNRERNNKKRLKLDLGQLVKGFSKMVRPFTKFRRSNREFSRKCYSFSASKPPEMNKGILLASGNETAILNKSESTMEELHAAIQAAIAHCKNSIDMEDKIRPQINKVL